MYSMLPIWMLIGIADYDMCSDSYGLKWKNYVLGNIERSRVTMYWSSSWSHVLASLWASRFDNWHDSDVVWHCGHIRSCHKLLWISWSGKIIYRSCILHSIGTRCRLEPQFWTWDLWFRESCLQQGTKCTQPVVNRKEKSYQPVCQRGSFDKEIELPVQGENIHLVLEKYTSDIKLVSVSASTTGINNWCQNKFLQTKGEKMQSDRQVSKIHWHTFLQLVSD